MFCYLQGRKRPRRNKSILIRIFTLKKDIYLSYSSCYCTRSNKTHWYVYIASMIGKNTDRHTNRQIANYPFMYSYSQKWYSSRRLFNINKSMNAIEGKINSNDRINSKKHYHPLRKQLAIILWKHVFDQWRNGNTRSLHNYNMQEEGKQSYYSYYLIDAELAKTDIMLLPSLRAITRESACSIIVFNPNRFNISYILTCL